LIYYICEEHGEEENVEKRVLKKEKDLGVLKKEEDLGEGGLVPYQRAAQGIHKQDLGTGRRRTATTLQPYSIRWGNLLRLSIGVIRTNVAMLRQKW
jgi:hypothetical protein